jgi:hypothetical protein
MKLKEHACVVLTDDLPAEGLMAGDAGTIIHVHRNHDAYEVEFMTMAGSTVAVATVLAPQVRPVGRHDIAHVRELARP